MAMRLGGEEGIKDALPLLLAHPQAIVADDESTETSSKAEGDKDFALRGGRRGVRFDN